MTSSVEQYLTYKIKSFQNKTNFAPLYIQRFAGYSSKAVSTADNILKMVKNVATRVSFNPFSWRIVVLITVWIVPASFPIVKPASTHMQYIRVHIFKAGHLVQKRRAEGRSRRAQTSHRSRGRTCSETPPWNETFKQARTL